MNKNIKAIFFDVDGTLVPFGSHSIPEEVDNSIRAACQKGIKAFVSTGRHISWIDNLGHSEFDGYVTANGAMCLLQDQISAPAIIGSYNIGQTIVNQYNRKLLRHNSAFTTQPS